MINKITLHRFKQFSEASISFKTNGLSVVTGGNNSGKTSLLQALAIWEYCKTILSFEKGKTCLLADSHNQGLGVSDDEFTPVPIPNLKHLWTNLNAQKKDEIDGYTLKICCYWGNDPEYHLEFGLSLVNDRLFIKPTDSNLTQDSPIPNIAYLPSFAGITDKETKIPTAIRQRLIGQGLSGAVLRNLLLDLYEKNQKKRRELKAERPKIKNSDLKSLRETDAWEVLVENIRELFKCDLHVTPFNDLYHSYIKVNIKKGSFRNTPRGEKRFRLHSGFNKRDIMSEGSGFLQWLSVYALLLNEKINIVLFDEPDAHLHNSLQNEMITRLSNISRDHQKQILISTHSSEIIKSIEHDKILYIKNRRGSYLTEDKSKISVLNGLGSEYAPKINQLQIQRNILFVENEFDYRLLKIWCDSLDLRWPNNLVTWHTSSGHKERKHLFIESLLSG